MNYIEYLNQFWATHREHYLTPCEAMTYFYILQRFNESRWKEQLPISMEQIVLGTGIHKVTARNARKRLADVGLIGYSTDKIGRGSCSLYRLKRVQLNGTILDHLIEESSTKLDHFNEENGTKLDHFNEENGTKLDHFDKEEIPPIPPKEENNIYLASRESRDAHTRMSEMDSIELLRMHFSQRMASESLMMSNKITAKEYKMLCEEILGEWLIAEGNAFPVDADRKRHFISTLRIKAEILRKQRGAGRTRQDSKHELLTSALNAVNNAINETDKQPLDSADDLPF